MEARFLRAAANEEAGGDLVLAADTAVLAAGGVGGKLLPLLLLLLLPKGGVSRVEGAVIKGGVAPWGLALGTYPVRGKVKFGEGLSVRVSPFEKPIRALHKLRHFWLTK